MITSLIYHYAELDLETGLCIGVHTTTSPNPAGEEFIAIPVYDPDYLLKYYINGNWYEDEEGTIPWTSSML